VLTQPYSAVHQGRTNTCCTLTVALKPPPGNRSFRKQKRRTSHKLGNPRLTRITFHTLRHWKATIEYAKTKDILYVQQLLGHKNLKTTLKYTQLVQYPQDEKYICKVARTVEEAKELVEAGFEYVTDVNECKLFKKRKLTFL